MTLLAAYSFDEASGNVLDASGNGRTVTFGGSLTRVTGHTNSGLSQSTTAADSAGPALSGMLTSNYTIMGWVKRSSNSVDGWLMEFKQSGSGDRGLLFTGGNVQSRCKNVAGTVFTVQVAQPTAGTWYHFACTNDGTTLKLFINGVAVGTGGGTAFSGGVRTNSTSSSLFDTTGSETILDDARYYDTALDAATITTLMGQPVTSGATMNMDAATGTGTPQAMSFTEVPTLGPATGTGTAQALSASKGLTLGPAAGTGTPQPMSFTKDLALGAATGSGAPAAIAASKAPVLGPAAGTGTPQALAPGKDLSLQNATGSGAAQAISLTPAGGMTLGPATGTGSPQAMTFAKAWALGAATGVGSPQALSNGKALALGAAAGSGAARQLALTKQWVFGAAQGAGTAYELAWSGPLPEYEAPDHWTITTRNGIVIAPRAGSFTARTRVSRYSATTRKA